MFCLSPPRTSEFLTRQLLSFFLKGETNNAFLPIYITTTLNNQKYFKKLVFNDFIIISVIVLLLMLKDITSDDILKSKHRLLEFKT